MKSYLLKSHIAYNTARTGKRANLGCPRLSGAIFPRKSRNPLHPNIFRYILQTVLYTFPKLLTRRICLKIKSSL